MRKPKSIARPFTVKHSCGCERELVARPREAAQYRRWMATIQCPDCREQKK